MISERSTGASFGYLEDEASSIGSNTLTLLRLGRVFARSAILNGPMEKSVSNPVILEVSPRFSEFVNEDIVGKFMVSCWFVNEDISDMLANFGAFAIPVTFVSQAQDEP